MGWARQRGSSVAIHDQTWFSAETSGVDSDTPAVTVCGELDALSAPELAQLVDNLIAQEPKALVLDMTGLTFMGAAGAGLIASARRRLPSECGVILRRPPPLVRRVLEIAKLDGPCIIED